MSVDSIKNRQKCVVICKQLKEGKFMKKIAKVLLIAGMIIVVAIAKPHKNYLSFRPFQVSFAYPLGTNGFNSLEYENGMSVNILYGINGALSGWEVGSIFNYNQQHAYGFQVAGLANITGGDQKGFQVGGLMNYADDDSYGFQLGGAINMTRRDRYGASFSGVLNYVGDDTKGFGVSGGANVIVDEADGSFIAGITNIVGGYSEGFMLAGGMNLIFDDIDGVMIAGVINSVSGSNYGFQLAPINIVGSDMGGAQIGVVNYAKAMEGFQLGVINYVGRDDGVLPLGLISIVEDGYYELEFSMDEISVANAKYKMGVEKLYNFFSAGLMYYKDRTIFRYGMGLGTLNHLTGPHYLSAELGTEHVINDWSWENSLNILSSLDINYKLRIGERFGLFVGPSINAMISSELYGGEYDAIRRGKVVYSYEWSDTKLAMWAGLNFGFSYLI